MRCEQRRDVAGEALAVRAIGISDPAFRHLAAGGERDAAGRRGRIERQNLHCSEG